MNVPLNTGKVKIGSYLKMKQIPIASDQMWVQDLFIGKKPVPKVDEMFIGAGVVVAFLSIFYFALGI